MYAKNSYYEIKERLNCFVECIVDIYFELYEVKTGIAYFNKQFLERNKEYKKNILLEKLEECKLSKEWGEEYEKKLGKISYTNRLKEKYRKYKNDIKI